MNPLDFLTAVLPSSEEHYCIFDAASKKHFFYGDVDSIVANVEKYEAKKSDFYFAVSGFRSNANRTAENAKVVKSFFLDLDCAEEGPKTYATKEEGMAELLAFLEKTRLNTLGNPIIVDSGGGYHVYWPLTENLDIATWKPIAENFKRLCKQEGMKIDMSVPADAARVLRVPGTTNWKRVDKFDTTFTVAVIQEADPEYFDASTFAKIVRDNLIEIPPVESLPQIPGKRPQLAPTAAKLKLFENSATSFKKILDRSMGGGGCGQLTHYFENASEDGMEPLWRGWLSIAQKCEDGEKACKKLSDAHPYSHDRMVIKLREIKGPYACIKFDSENPGICNNCQHFGKITNPLALGRVVKVTTEEQVVELSRADDPVEVEETEVKIKYTRPTPPYGFSYGDNGGIFYEEVDKDGNGNTTTRQKMLLPYNLFLVDILKQGSGEHTVHMIAERPEGAVDVMFPQRAYVSQDEMTKALANANIVALNGQEKTMFYYVRGCIGDASANRAARKVPSNYGWQDDETFVHHNTIYSDEAIVKVPIPGMDNLFRITDRRGTLENWRKRFSLLASSSKNNDEVIHPLLAAACVGFGSVIMEFSGIDGMIFHLGHRESGTGKSYALKMAASIWGHPTKYCVSSGTSDVAMLQRAGLLNSLPLISDEITSKSRADMEWFPSFCFSYSEGNGKDRMESNANKERLNESRWRGQGLMASNTVMLDYMAGTRAHSSEGELRRMLEYNPKTKITWTEVERELVKTVEQDYGIAGPLFVQWLVANRDVAKAMFKKVEKRVREVFQVQDDERFWIAGCAAIITGAILAGSKYANIIDLPIEGIIAALKKIVYEQRSMMKANERQSIDVLSDYTTTNYGNLVVLSAASPIAGFGDGSLVEKNTLRTRVAGRVEHDVEPGCSDFYIEEVLLRTHCSTKGYSYTDVKKDLEEQFEVKYHSKFNLLNGTNGPPMRVNCIMIRQKKTDEEVDY